MLVSREEREIGFSDERIRSCVEQIESEGFVVLDECLDLDFVAQMREQVLGAFERKRHRMGISPAEGYSLVDYPGIGGNHGYNRWNMRLPSQAPFIDNRLVGHPVVLSVIREFLGDQASFGMIACDINMPRSTVQELHRDRSTFALIVNVPLVDMSIENGATHVFPRTHRMPNRAFSVDAPLPYCPTWPPSSWKGEFLCVPAGSVIIRDVRMAHRGMVNNTDEPRPLININVNALNHTTVPFHGMTSMVEKWCRRSRSKALATKDMESLKLWNGFGQILCYRAKTDRFDKRRIPGDVWSRLSADAQRLLRYAEIEGVQTAAYRAERSLKHLDIVPQFLAGNLKRKRAVEGVRSLPGLVGDGELDVIQALRKNAHSKSDCDILLQAMKKRGLDV